VDKIDGVILTPLKRIYHPKGDIYHAMKKSDDGFSGFGEAYFSTIAQGEVKGWKKHKEMVLNLVVPVGSIRFVIYDDRQDSGTNGIFFDTVLSKDNYARLTVPNGVWMAFEGIDEGHSMLLNIASIEHDPSEATNIDLDAIKYVW
jgi:dTDP-4-dehydrorhamnose 3,5-epimerase